MAKLPAITAKELVKALVRMGFFKSRQKGSHLILCHQDGRRTVVPMHTGSIPRGTLKAILRDIEITKDELQKYL